VVLRVTWCAAVPAQVACTKHADVRERSAVDVRACFVIALTGTAG
jgi:hypothetical protein